jgi:hypothetical protein
MAITKMRFWLRWIAPKTEDLARRGTLMRGLDLIQLAMLTEKCTVLPAPLRRDAPGAQKHRAHSRDQCARRSLENRGGRPGRGPIGDSRGFWKAHFRDGHHIVKAETP